MRRFGLHAGRPSRCRLSVVSLAVLAMLSPLGVVSSADAAVAKASPSVLATSGFAAVASTSQAVSASGRIRITPTTAMVGETFTMTGKLPNVKSRSVRLQQKFGTRWVTTTKVRTRTTRYGDYTLKFSAKASGSYTLRVWAPRARVAKKMRASYVSPSRRISATRVSQAAWLSMPTTMVQNTSATATMTFRPIRAGRQVALQVFQNGAWVNIAIGTQSATGTASLPVPAAPPSTYQFRAITFFNGAPEVYSATTFLTVTP